MELTKIALQLKHKSFQDLHDSGDVRIQLRRY